VAHPEISALAMSARKKAVHLSFMIVPCVRL
jgi:hypothetical protein